MVSAKGPDPSEFEKEVVPDEENGGSEKGKEKGEEATEGKGGEGNGDNVNEKGGDTTAVQEKDALPTDVKVKLRKLEKLEGRYQGRRRLGLRSGRVHGSELT